MKSIVCLLVMAVVCFSCSEKKTTVHLKGQLKGMGPQEVMRYNGAVSMVGDSRDVLLNTDSEGRFDTIIELSEPEYFSISRNTLYLTPGDDLEMVITENNNEAEFKGIGAEANTYMKKRLFPKGGSFLEGGRNTRTDFASTKVLIDSLASARRAELQALKNVSPEFKRLEGARILADVVNSCICYASYGKEYQFDWAAYQRMTPEEQEVVGKKLQEMRETFYAGIATDMNRMYRELTDTALLDVAVVRDVLSYAGEDKYGWFEGIELPDRTHELYEAYGKVGALREKVNLENVEAARKFVAESKNKDIASEVKHKVDQAGKLVQGQPAFDIVMEDVDGNMKRLSDFRGKVIYVDLWATWCGPCIQESPAFEALSKKYEGKDIVFVPISRDTRKSDWKSYLKNHHKELTQYNSQDLALKDDWCIMYIPRFIVIDKDFKIVDAYAPRPSEEEAIVPLLDSLLN
ncbi:TlpA disulfide reductase family protein [Odoribacter sp. AF15-53]|uniref:TlpA family protein disulfide reductase n=1 Tax=Odoribacter sp. AF15-53 TaxID=2292236 RepID=UPI000E4FC4EF|nr:TlpA disulfide reductase family protein [Odoribacter sp. AF15-53]RHR78910.1 TlpA family protein disulfide reductase [Odoribacter sp. AF15-53]